MLTGLGVERNQEPESSLEAGVWGRAEEAGARRLDCLWARGPSRLRKQRRAVFFKLS